MCHSGQVDSFELMLILRLQYLPTAAASEYDWPSLLNPLIVNLDLCRFINHMFMTQAREYYLVNQLNSLKQGCICMMGALRSGTGRIVLSRLLVKLVLASLKRSRAY